MRKQVFVRLAQDIENYVFRTANAIIVVSKYLRDKISPLAGNNQKIHVIPNVVDLMKFVLCREDNEWREKVGMRTNSVALGFIG